MSDPQRSSTTLPAFGTANLIIGGVATAYEVRQFEGPLSVKWVRKGAGQWSTSSGRFVVCPDTVLVLNDGQVYDLIVDTKEPTETFCIFFQTGFVEDVVRGSITPHDRLLDEPEYALTHGFFEHLRSAAGPIGTALRAVAAVHDRKFSEARKDWASYEIAGALAQEVRSDVGRPSSLAAVKASTRAEIGRRLLQARDAVEDDLALPWRLADMAMHAAMAPYHFHRSWREWFGETPRGYLSRRRLERAHALLCTTRSSVTDVCAAVGFESLGTFSSAFKARYGYPPSHAQRPDQVGANRA